MKKYTEQSAYALVNRQQGVTINSKTIIVEKSLGLSVWGAIDFLRNHCAFTVAIRQKKENN